MTREMLINTVEGQECRIAIVENGVLEELYVERVSAASHVGNIYKGRITNVEPSIQAAFVDFGLGKNGFLHISDINPSYFPKGRRGGQAETVGRKKGHRDRPPIQECLRRGQEVIVQLTKEGIGTKGPTLTTYLSIPGRLLVMMPGMSRLGVSRKIENDDARDKARAILAELAPPQDMGFIVRTAAIDRPKKEFLRDLNYLLRLWRNVKRRINSTKTPAEIYQESDLVTRTIRDIYNAEIGRIVCDNQTVAVKVKEFLDVAMPRSVHNIELYTGKQGLFHEYGLEAEIEKIYARRIELPSGGSLVFDQAEALVAIDVNSGRFREHSDAETTATKMNVEAAKEIARQLRLRDLGGVVIIDFIDMREEKNRRTVERVLRDEMKSDRAKSKVLRISAFGIIEMTRQRVRPSLKHSIFRTCGHCQGIGLIKSEESQSLLVMRNLQRAASNEQVAQIEVSVTPSVAYHLANLERRRIVELETATSKQIVVKADPSLAGSAVVINCTNTRGSVVAWEQPTKLIPQATKIETVPLETIVPAAAMPEGEEVEPFLEEGEEEFAGAPTTPALGEGEEGAEEHAHAMDDEAFAAAEAAADEDQWAFERERKTSQEPEAAAAAGQRAEASPTRPAPAQRPPGQPRPAPAQQPRPQGGRRGRHEGRPQEQRGGAPKPPVAPGQGAAPAPVQPPVGQAPVAAGQGVAAPGQPPAGAGPLNGQGGENGEGGRRRRRRGRRGGRRHRRRQEMLPGQEGLPQESVPQEGLPQEGLPQKGTQPEPTRRSVGEPAARKPAQGAPAQPATPAQQQAPAPQPKPQEEAAPVAGKEEPWMALFGGQDPKKAPAAKPAQSAQAPAAAEPAPQGEPKKRGRRSRGRGGAKQAAKPTTAAAAPEAAAPAQAAAPQATQQVAPAETATPAAKRPARGRKTKPAPHAGTPKPAAPAVKITKGRARRAGEPILQDVEYYEQEKLVQKAAKKRRPTDEIPDEDDQDFSHE